MLELRTTTTTSVGSVARRFCSGRRINQYLGGSTWEGEGSSSEKFFFCVVYFLIHRTKSHSKWKSQGRDSGLIPYTPLLFSRAVVLASVSVFIWFVIDCCRYWVIGISNGILANVACTRPKFDESGTYALATSARMLGSCVGCVKHRTAQQHARDAFKRSRTAQYSWICTTEEREKKEEEWGEEERSRVI